MEPCLLAPAEPEELVQAELLAAEVEEVDAAMALEHGFSRLVLNEGGCDGDLERGGPESSALTETARSLAALCEGVVPRAFSQGGEYAT